MKYKVRIGYVLHLGAKPYKAGEVVDVAPEDIASQSWKVEKVQEEQDKKDKAPKDKKGKKDKAPPLPPGFKAIPSPPSDTAMKGQDATQKGDKE